MIAKTNNTPAVPTSGSATYERAGRTITKCITFEREALSDLQELAWAHNVPLDAMVREAVDAYRRA